MATIFETARLLARQWVPTEDAEQAFEMYGDPMVTRFLGRGQVEHSIEITCARLNRYSKLNDGFGSLALVEKHSARIVGTVFLKQLPDNLGQLTPDYEVGWHLRQASWGKGYATEAGRGAFEYGFSVLRLPVLYAVVNPANVASMRVAQRLGMSWMGRTNKYYGEELELFRLEAGQHRKV